VSNWQIARHRVAIAGRVIDGGTAKPIVDAVVSLSGMPAVFEQKLAMSSLMYGKRWNTLQQRPDRTRSREGGLFYFLDLPDGTYNLIASIPNYGNRYGTAQQSAVISRNKKGDAKISFVNLTLPPTAVSGKIIGPGHKTGVVLAEVRVKGSGERTFTNEEGQYTVAGIEPGKRVLLVSAQGYRPQSQPVTLGNAGTSQTLNFNLTRESG
jgi:hypothetical protein